MTSRLDIVIPVYNEGENILATLRALREHVETPARVLICYDREDDGTLAVVRKHPKLMEKLKLEFVYNQGEGAHGAVMSGIAYSRAPYVVVYAADDDYNAKILDDMVTKAEMGCEVVCASRFMKGGSMQGCPPLKDALVRAANFTLYWGAGIRSHDSTNGFRLFRRRLLQTVPVRSRTGFCYSIELLVKCHRLGWQIGEVPARWFERKKGESRFRVLRWLPAYLRWYCYAFVTRIFFTGPRFVAEKLSAAFAR